MSHLNIPPAQPRALDIYPNGGKQYGLDTFEITVRFSASLPDLPLSIPVAGHPTTATIKQRIRSSLPDDLEHKRIRLIHAGKALDDATPLSISLKRLVSRPPSRTPTPGPYDSGAETDASRTAKAKGKLPIRDPPAARIYIHCSIGDATLSATDIAAEVALASSSRSSSTTPTDARDRQTLLRDQHDQAPTDDDALNTTTEIPAPRGFDRLSSAGFSPSEINALRLQFMSIQAHTHTPDTMPSPNTLRAMEDQWLDNSGSSDLSLAQGGSGGDDGGRVLEATEDGGRGALDDMIWGTTIGFFWPIGCLIWGIREEGIFSPRRKIALVIGIVMNLGLGFVRWGG